MNRKPASAAPPTDLDPPHETRQSTSEILTTLAQNITTDRLTIGHLIDVLQDRAFGILLLILALPCAVPFLYGIPQIVSVPLLFVAAQIVIGRHEPWLPEAMRQRSFSTDAFRNMVNKSVRYIKWLEIFSSPRLTWLTKGGVERLLGVLLVIFSASIAIPLPLTNTVPGIAVGIVALGLIERDGVMILGGAFLGVGWVVFLITLAGGIWTLLQQAFSWLT